MTVATQNRKLSWLAFVLGLPLAGLGYRLVDLQVARHDEFQALADRNTVRTFQREPVRGQILDCRGILLATLGVAVVLDNLALAVFSGDTRTIDTRTINASSVEKGGIGKDGAARSSHASAVHHVCGVYHHRPASNFAKMRA